MDGTYIIHEQPEFGICQFILNGINIFIFCNLVAGAADLPGDFDPEQKKEVGYVIIFGFLKLTVKPITCMFSMIEIKTMCIYKLI